MNLHRKNFPSALFGSCLNISLDLLVSRQSLKAAMGAGRRTDLG